MPRALRQTPSRPQLVELTGRTVQGRFLLKPNTGFPEIVAGCLGRALELYPVRLHALAFMSNHYHMLASVPDAKQRADFMRHFAGNLSKEVGRFHRWRGPLWARRYDSIDVSHEPEAQIQRLRYLLSHGVKEGLVRSPLEWPGLHAARHLIDQTPIRGLWLDRTARSKAKRRGETLAPEAFATEYAIELAPLPCWGHLPPEAVARRVAEMVEAIEAEGRARHRRVVGVPGVLLVHAHEAPDEPSKATRKPRHKPRVHAVSSRVREMWLEAYREFEIAFRRAAERLKRGDPHVVFPPGSFPPGLPFVHDTS